MSFNSHMVIKQIFVNEKFKSNLLFPVKSICNVKVMSGQRTFTVGKIDVNLFFILIFIKTQKVFSLTLAM